MVNKGIFVKICSFKQLCQMVLLRSFKTTKQFAVRDVSFVIFHLYGTQSK